MSIWSVLKVKVTYTNKINEQKQECLEIFIQIYSTVI